MSERIIWLKEGAPFFLNESENGAFYAVKAFRYWTNPGETEYEYDWNIGKLIVGHDIIETPNRSVSILVKCNKEGEEVLLSLMQECIKLAAVSSHDYVTVEPFGERLGNLICLDGKIKLIEIKPRFFKKIK